MAAHAKWGVDLAIDLEHQMLDGSTSDPTARDARGWFRLELRPDGSLWATNVTWTPDGLQRLAEKRQRYVSPAFGVDPETSRITSIINVALVAIPATHETPALVAASARGDGMLSAEILKSALDALMAGDEAACMDILKGIVVEAAAGSADPDATTEDAPPPVGDGGADEAVEMAVDPEKKDKPEEVMAASARLMRLTGKATFVDSIDEVEVWRTKALKSDEMMATLAKERAILELGKRKENAVALTKLGAETPHTSGLAVGKLCDRLLTEPLADQTARVAALLAARGGKLSAVKPPAGDGTTDAHGLTASQLAHCKATGCDPATFARLKAGRTPNGV